MAKRFGSFRDFYPFYLSEHSHPICRRLHFVGSLLVLACVALAAITRDAWWLVGAPLAGYGCAWVGHFFFEHNRPATFTYPVYSLIGDWVMFKDIIIGKVRLW